MSSDSEGILFYKGYYGSGGSAAFIVPCVALLYLRILFQQFSMHAAANSSDVQECDATEA